MSGNTGLPAGGLRLPAPRIVTVYVEVDPAHAMSIARETSGSLIARNVVLAIAGLLLMFGLIAATEFLLPPQPGIGLRPCAPGHCWAVEHTRP